MRCWESHRVGSTSHRRKHRGALSRQAANPLCLTEYFQKSARAAHRTWEKTSRARGCGPGARAGGALQLPGKDARTDPKRAEELSGPLSGEATQGPTRTGQGAERPRGPGKGSSEARATPRPSAQDGGAQSRAHKPSRTWANGSPGLHGQRPPWETVWRVPRQISRDEPTAQPLQVQVCSPENGEQGLVTCWHPHIHGHAPQLREGGT